MTLVQPTWVLHVEEEFSSAHHNGPEGHKCNETHGHDWLAVVEITYHQVNELGWGPDFGDVKGVIRPMDHQNLNKLFAFPPSAELIGQWLYHEIWGRIGIQPDFVEIHEGGANRIRYTETQS